MYGADKVSIGADQLIDSKEFKAHVILPNDVKWMRPAQVGAEGHVLPIRFYEGSI